MTDLPGPAALSALRPGSAGTAPVGANPSDPAGRVREGAGASGAPEAAPAFEQVLGEAMNPPAPVSFSRHAAERIHSRGIHLSEGDLTRLGRALDLAAARGARDSLVLSDSLAYVVNVPSRTVVTALYGDQAKGSVFTRIDSAVVL
jgi:flagellar operon protein